MFRRLTAADAVAYRALRLDGLRLSPDAFGATLEEEEGWSLDDFADRLQNHFVWGGWLGDRLVAMAALEFGTAAKMRHKALLWSVYVHPDARGAGMAERSLRCLLAEAAGQVEDVRLCVVSTNLGAIRLYERLGFVQYGLEPRAMRVGDDYQDEVLMALRLRAV